MQSFALDLIWLLFALDEMLGTFGAFGNHGNFIINRTLKCFWSFFCGNDLDNLSIFVEENSIMVIWSKILISQAPSKFQPIGHDDVKALQVVLLKYFVLLSSHQVENPISIWGIHFFTNSTFKEQCVEMDFSSLLLVFHPNCKNWSSRPTCLLSYFQHNRPNPKGIVQFQQKNLIYHLFFYCWKLRRAVPKRHLLGPFCSSYRHQYSISLLEVLTFLTLYRQAGLLENFSSFSTYPSSISFCWIMMIHLHILFSLFIQQYL